MDPRLKYYLLGFFYADGCMSKKLDSLSIRLSGKDYDFLCKIGEIFDKKVKKYQAKIKDKEYKSCRLNICGKKNTEFWYNLGIIPNKTYQNDSKVFDNVTSNYKWDFIRGYFDGDGTIGSSTWNEKPHYKSSPKYFVIFVTLNEKLLRSIRKFINNSLNLTAKVFKSGKKYYRIRYSGNKQTRLIGKSLYKNKGNIFLKRKFEKFNEIPVFNNK